MDKKFRMQYHTPYRYGESLEQFKYMLISAKEYILGEVDFDGADRVFNNLKKALKACETEGEE